MLTVIAFEIAGWHCDYVCEPSMKMETTVQASKDGVVKEVYATACDAILRRDLLIVSTCIIIEGTKQILM
ncbi:hypothetical protein ABIA69_001358 [Lysinibacillus parviboronicapiens]|uniref:Lipoyl-binding domain-containing protein n=1 Tax=Lysinibacillus parviboronicapiens TaxID=436516 RepID=A0ABV2PHD2_9BACI